MVVQFMLGGEDTPDTVDNVDAHIYLPDGTYRYATFFTTEAINALLRKDAQSEKTGGGRTLLVLGSGHRSQPRRAGDDGGDRRDDPVRRYHLHVWPCR